ncbi:MAG: hypothetical protein PHE59_05085, partial [Patescibacteria group bacterium]|nr:hypothetical protein [Patescibacteria group bacterium]
MEETKNNRHTLTLIFKEPVSEGIVIILKGQYPKMKIQRKGKVLTLSNIHHENAKDIMFTGKEEEGEFTYKLHRDGTLKDTRENEYQKLLEELDNPDIEDLRAATICDSLIRRYGMTFYIANNGTGKQYIKDGAICEKFEKVKPQIIVKPCKTTDPFHRTSVPESEQPAAINKIRPMP